MNLHQVLTGAVNAGDHCYSVGSVEGVPFTVYGAGCNIVILARNFERVQIIPGVCHGNVQVSCINCSTDIGKIAAAYGKQVAIFEPSPLLQQTSAHKLDYKWIQTATIQMDYSVSVLSWNLEGTRLLTGGEWIQMWKCTMKPESNAKYGDEAAKAGQPQPASHSGVSFQVGSDEAAPSLPDEDASWDCIWHCRTSQPVSFLRFSPDGTLFASAGKCDRLVKIWHNSQHKVSDPGGNARVSAQQVDRGCTFGFVYAAHPRAVTGLSWRKTSKFMPRGSVANMLVTSCRDNICRLWVQTLLPEDGLINVQQIEALANQTPRLQTQRHRQRILQKLRHMKSLSEYQRRQAAQSGKEARETIPSLPSTYSVHDFHSFGLQGSGVAPGLHFHLAASINAETDIPLVPSMSGAASRGGVQEPNFVLHWLNNKEMSFSSATEQLIQELSLKALQARREQQRQQLAAQRKAAEDADAEENQEEAVEPDDPEAAGATKSSWQGRSGLKSLRLGSVATTTALAEEALPGSQSAKAFSPASSSASLATEASGKNVEQQSLGNALDHKIESLLREWHQSPDLLFSIHPVDGSFLVWLVDWLDECSPGSFRQALVSFSSRIPTAIPLGDAATLSHHLALYLPTAGLDLRTVLSGLGAWAQPSPLTPVAPVTLVVPPQPVQQQQQGSVKSGSMQQGSAQQGPVHQAEENEDAEDKPRPFCCQAAPTPSVCMLSKHHNGSLNLWHLTFSEESRFTHVLSIGHAARVSGHRFRINDITCHPVLPLLLTTSHHNLPKGKEPLDEEDEQPQPQDYLDKRRRDSAPTAAPTEGFCSELILWKVESVGPLSKSGGVAELARINSLEPSAFSNVAWVPTLLPSTTLGSISNSPSACFVASDGLQLRVYQAVIDARTLLAEVLAAACRKDNADTISLSSTTSSGMDMHHAGLQEEFRIVSLQSTARPGCIVELDAIADATNDWQNTQLLHVFQEQLIMGAKQGALGGSTSAPGEETLEKNVGLLETSFQECIISTTLRTRKPGKAFVDLRHTAVFEEPFYLVVLEKTGTGRTMLHMWRLVISSRAGAGGKGQHDGAGFPENVPQHEDDAASNASSRSGSPEPTDTGQSGQPAGSPHASPLRITTSKVCTQELPLPHDVEIAHAAPAAGHVSSSNIYPACFAPYVLSTACTDGLTRFWKCKVDCEGDGTASFTWVEWEMTLNKSSSVIQVPGQPISVSCAYSGRVACAYKRGHSFNRPGSSNPSDRCVNLGVAIYECESTGGSEWILEDTVLLNNVSLPRLDQTAPGVDLGSLVDTTLRHRKTADSLVQRLASDGDLSGPPSSLQRLLSVPSYATLHTLRRAVIEQGNQGTLVHKSLIQLDWVSSEDGSHVLTVAVGSRILLFAPVAKDVIQQGGTGLETQSLSSGTPRPLLKQVSSLAAPVASTGAAEAVRWLQIRCTRLETADGLPPLPMQVSWVRDGILVVGMDSEMHIYSQWRPQKGALKGLKNNLVPLAAEEENICKVRMLPEEELLSRVQELSQLRLGPGAPLGLARNASSSSAQAMDKKKQRVEAAVSSVSRGTAAAKESETTVVSPLPDLGLFETCRLAWPMLPQYHPKQLMELLGFGKIRRVKAILSHLVRCVSKSGQAPGGVVAGGNAAEMASEGAAEEEGGDEGVRGWSRSRTLSLAAPAAGSAAHSPREGGNIVPEELQLDYVEIQSIPPLPLYALLAADKQLAPGAAGGRKDASPSGTGADAGQAGAKGNQADYSALFETIPKKEETLDDILQEDAQPKPKKARERHKSAADKDPNYFGMRQARLLTQLLTHCHLPGLSSVDQMHLLALADTLASFHGTLADRLDSEIVHTAPKDNVSRQNYEMTIQATPDSLDDCGLRYFLAVRHHTYLLRCLPLAQRAQLQRQGLGPHYLVWAFHSETQEELAQLIPALQKPTLRWSELRELGIGWWVRSNQLLRRIIEKLAKSSFQANQNPLDAALYYMAMKKKTVLAALFRSVNDKRMSDFFQNDFSQDRWRKAALKNAYVLLGKQQFEYAAAFFLLANAVKDAVQVCLSKLEDLQLAMVVVRLYEGDLDSVPEHLRRLLDAEVLGQPEGAEGPSMELAHPDPFLRSMALWLLQHYEDSLTTLLQTRVGQEHHRIHQETQHLSSSTAGRAANASDKASVSGPPAADDTADPGVFNFYLYLRTHPLVVRRNLAKSMSMRRKHGRAVLLSGFKPGSAVSKALTPGGTTSSDTITPLERRLFFTTSHAHFRAGCPPLALEVLSRLPNCILDDSGNATAEEGSPAKRKDSDGGPPSGAVSNGPVQQKADEFDWSQPLAKAPQKAEDFDWSQPLSTSAATQKADAFDWSQPLSTSAPKNKADDFDWSQPLASTAAPKSDSFDWNQPGQSTPHFENTKGSKQLEEEDTLAQNRVETLDIMAQQLKFMACLKIMMEELSTLATGFEVDGGQLRHQLYVWLERCVAALKELCQYGAAMQVSGSSSVSETSILPDAAGEEGPAGGRDRANTGTADGAQAGTPVPTLHAILVADKQDFEAKLVRAARRKLWLKANEALLRTLLSYTGLHGAHGGGLAAVRMELNLLLQELQQDRSQQQLLSPLPFPTTLPLLAASVACQKTVVADPVRLLQMMAHDILLTVMDLDEPPGAATSASTFSRVSVLWDLGTSLSACIYQALCDSDSFGLKGQQGSNRGLDVEDCLSLSVVYQNSHLLVGHATRRPRLGSTDEPLLPTTQPSKWPGVQSLRALMARDKDEDGPRLHTLLCESFVAVYLSQLIHALASCDCHVLYRLVGQRFNQRSWSMLFGGGAKKLLRVSAGGSSGAVTPSAAAPEKEATATVETGIFDAITRQRVKWNMKILPQLKSEAPQANVREDRPTYREIFVPPIMSMMSCFMCKPALTDQMAAIDYDSAASLSSDEEDGAGGHDEEIDEDDVFKDTGTTEQQRRPSQGSRLEQLDPGSYAWALMRYAVVKMANHSLRDFLSVAGIELQELPVTSPLLHASLRAMDHWLRHLREALEAHGSAPPGLLPNSHVEAAGQGAAPVQGPPILKYKVLLEVDNTPFSRSKHPAAYPARRLWNYLVRQEGVQDLFIRYLFSHKVAPLLDTQAQAQATKEGGAATTTPGGEGDDRSIDGGLPDPVRIIHKDQESISAFCISQVNEGILSLATPKELQELDISALLEPAPWLDDEAEFDILALNRPPEPPAGQALDFLVVQHPLDRHNASVGTGLPAAASSAFTSPTSANPPSLAAQTGRGTTMMKGLNFPGSTNAHFCQIVLERSRLMIKPLKRHRVDSVRRLASHPVLPLYLSGCQDGSVSLWEWGHAQPVSTPRLAGTFAKVTSLLFNQQGNKFGVTDGDGNLSLWQVSMTSTNAKPFFSASCHTKQASDFAFVSSTSLIATAGHSTENRNVCLWDTLLPQRKALVASFSCHEHGSSAVVFAPQNQLLISAGKKGDVFIFDVRQRQLRHKFQAHETAIKCLAMDPREEYYITGSADGDIKVWGLPVHVLLYAFPSEHSRSTLFRNIGMGVTHLLTDAKGRLYSCGADGSMKMRQLPDRDAVVASFT